MGAMSRNARRRRPLIVPQSDTGGGRVGMEDDAEPSVPRDDDTLFWIGFVLFVIMMALALIIFL